MPHGATETGWWADCVYTAEKFETGLAFFADAQGRITRFSRAEADLAAARRLAGQAVLPGLVNAHSHAWQRSVRGRADLRARTAGDLAGGWRDALERTAARLSDEDVFDSARMAFLEMLYSGITCVGEFHFLRHRPDGTAWEDPNRLAREVVRAAHDVGLRIALLNVAVTRGDATPAAARSRDANVDAFLRHTEALRLGLEREYPADEAWLGTGIESVAAVSLEDAKAVATYARAQRMRFHAHISATAAENAACVAAYGRTPIAWLAENGIVDKRFTAVDALQLSEEEIKLLGAARATICACPGAAEALGRGHVAADRLLAASAGVALGSDAHGRIDLLQEARRLEHALRADGGSPGFPGANVPAALLHAATVTGARSLGATGGALEVGRPADFFTVNLSDPSIAGADLDSLAANIVYALERRAIRDVWIGARQRIANGRHVNHGAIIGRYIEGQKRVWAAET